MDLQEIKDMIMTHSGEEVSSVEAFTKNLASYDGTTLYLDGKDFTSTSLKTYYFGTVNYSLDVTYNDGGTSFVTALNVWLQNKTVNNKIFSFSPYSTAATGLLVFPDSLPMILFSHLSLLGNSGDSKLAHCGFVGYKITVKG